MRIFLIRKIFFCEGLRNPLPIKNYAAQKIYYMTNTNKKTIEYKKKWKLANKERVAEMDKQWALNNPEKIKKKRKKYIEKRRKLNKLNPKEARICVLQRYNVTLNDYNEIFTKQNGCCAICGINQLLLKNNLCVDHDHNCCPTGKSCGKCVRGLLCPNCNRGLGFFNDSIDNLKNCIDYLNKYNKS